MREMKALLSPFLSLMREMKAPLSPFLSLIKEKEAKENQGLTEAGEVAGGNHALEKSTRQTARLSVGGVFRSCRFAIPFYSLLRLSTGLALAARQF